jgi:hypothetical protein
MDVRSQTKATRSYTDMMEVASFGGTANGKAGDSENGGLAALLGGNKNKNTGKGKGKNSNILSSLLSGGKSKSKASNSSNSVLSGLAALLGGKGATARLAEEEVAAAWLENYLRIHNPDDEKIERSLAADVMATRTVNAEQDVAAPPPSTETTAPRSMAMGSRASFRVRRLITCRNFFLNAV